MIHFVLIDDCFPINTRNRKILNSLEKHYGEQAKLTVITWDRDDTYHEEYANYHVYKKLSAYGNKTRKLLNLFGYWKFCKKLIKDLHPDVVIASHWNNLLMVPKLDRKRQMLIYENLDVPTENFIARKISSTLEHWKMRQVDLTLHASRFFTKLYPSSCNQLVLENKPTFNASTCDYTPHSPLRIAFIGMLRYLDIMENLVDAVKNDNRFQLYFYGGGHAEEQLKKHTAEASNVFFTGAYKYEDVSKLYLESDVVWAAYPNKDFNVKYAISNKFHESLIFGIPTIYSDKTYLGEYAEKNSIGMSVDPYSVEAIRQLFERLNDNRELLINMHKCMKEFQKQQTTWEDDFSKVIQAIDNMTSDI